MEKKALSENLEDYLEVILELETTMKVARGKDIAEKLGIKQGSVTGALKTLREKGLINWEKYGFITLTDEGKDIAENITMRHGVLKNFLTDILQIDVKTAEATACRMEHAIDEKSMDRLVTFIDFLENSPLTGPEFIQSFIDYTPKKSRKRKKKI